MMKRPDLIKHVDAYTKAMEETIERYEKAIKLGVSKSEYDIIWQLDCPLCNVHIYDTSTASYSLTEMVDDDNCFACGCPWVVITGYMCVKEKQKTYLSNDVKDMKKRIQEIKEWINLYKDYKQQQQKDFNHKYHKEVYNNE